MSPDMNGGRGLIFPYRLARTNSPLNFSVDYEGNWVYCKNTRRQRSCRLGITGYSVTTNDSVAKITIDINKDNSVHYTFNSIRIFHDPTSYQLSIKIYDTVIYGSYYDSLGYTLFYLDDFYDVFELEICRDTINDSFMLQGISFYNDGPGVVYNSVGVNGAMLDSYLKSELYKKHLKALDPELVIFSIGTNDAYTRHFDKEKFRKEYMQLLDSTLAVVPGADIIITIPNDSYLYKRYVNHNTEKMREIIYHLAYKYHCGIWDFYSIMGGLNSVKAWYSLNLMKYDKIHFNRNGYLLKGELFFSAFLKGWEKHLTDTQAEFSEND
ncbi:hypothetical protein ES708_14500 [subsurface metagenome]